ncbi:leucyl aminopeptidase, partial [candidate division WOR-3 bacterium]|nr:leucyl aminopeptidase [candidate division WOR-3 bacterium]
MFDIRKYYEAENAKVRDSYNNTIVRIREICDKTMDYQKVEKKKEYYRFFNRIGNLILKFANLEKNLNKEYFSKKTFEELQRENDEFYSELFLKNYKKNYPEPTYCVNIFSDGFGQLLSCFYIEYRQFITHTFYHKIYKMEEYNRLFIDVFDYIRNNKIEYETLKRLITAHQKKDKTNEIIFRMKEQFDIDFRYFKDIVEKADISDLRYLFSYGKFITDNEIKTAKYLLNYPKKKIKQLTNQITTAYIKGFIRDNKDITKKSTVGIIFNVGQELIIRQLIKDLKRYNLDATILGIYSSKASKQYNYDHRFDLALYLDSEYTGLIEKGYSKACKNCSDIMSIFSGLIHFGNFGKLPFTPENKKECLKLSDEQQKLFQIHQNNIMKIQDKYMPRQETSFTAISFPSPEIGENFEKIFEDILEINMLSTDKYELIQQRIIAILDKADFVHVKGREKNKTDIIVKMQEIKN